LTQDKGHGSSTGPCFGVGGGLWRHLSVSNDSCCLTHNFMSILWKMVVYIEKSPVTSSNCYKTIKTAIILIKLGTNVNWTIAFVTTCPGLNFLLLWQWGEISKLPKITISRWFFPSKLISKCCNFSADWDRIKCFLALVTHYLTVDLGSFLASHKSPNRRHKSLMVVPSEQFCHIPALILR
jgi:hypothetical protein